MKLIELPSIWDLTAAAREDQTRLLRGQIAARALEVAAQARRGSLDALADAHDDLGAALREGMPWMRAAEMLSKKAR